MSLTASPILRIHAHPFESMEGRIGPIRNTLYLSMLYRIVVDIIDMTTIIHIVPDGMLPESPLPDPSLTLY